MGAGQARHVSPAGVAQGAREPQLAPPPGGPVPVDGVVGGGGAADQDALVPVVFTWTQGGQNVAIAGSFSNWREQIPMVRSGNEFSVVQDLPKGVHQYKFIVDGHWRFAPDKEKKQDSQGNVNNVIDISNYQRFQPDSIDDKDQPVQFCQHIPDPNDYTVDAPAVPMALHKSSSCALPPKPQSGQPLSIPLHSLSDHIYLHARGDEGLPTSVAVTHRYGQKYSTLVLATQSVAPDSEGPGPNFLKLAVRARGPGAACGAQPA